MKGFVKTEGNETFLRSTRHVSGKLNVGRERKIKDSLKHNATAF